MLFRHDDFDLTGFFVQNHFRHFRRLKRVHKEGGLVFIPRNDVDLLALKLVHDGLHAAAAHTDAGTDWVDGTVMRDNGDLGARAGVAGNRFDLDDAVVDFRHFHFEQLGHEFRRGAAQENLRAALLAAHVFDVDADAVVRAIAFAANLLVPAQDRFASAHVDDDVAIFLALDQTVDDGPGAVFEFFVLAVTLSFADLLQDDLLGRLRRDAAHFNRRHFLDESVANLGVGHVLLGLLYGELGLIVLKLIILDHGADAGEGGLAGLAVDVHPDVHLGAVARLGGTGEGFFHRFDDQTRVDHLLARHRLGGLQQLKLVCRCNGH